MSLREEYLQSLLQTERTIKRSEDITVELVRNTQTGDLCIKKTVANKSLGEIYHTLKHIDHAHIVKVLDVFELETSLVVIEEYIQGQNLSVHLKAPVDEKVAIDWIEQLGNALEFLHQQSPPIIHRDLKPSNVMVQRGQIILIDFDIARSVKKGAGSDTSLLGTSGYAPPEQYGFAQTDTRSDIYALGILFRECLQGKTAKWEPIIKKCTALDPASRYQIVGQVIDAIKGRERNINKRAILVIVAFAVMSAGVSIFSHRLPSTLPETTSKLTESPETTIIEPTTSPIKTTAAEAPAIQSQRAARSSTTIAYNEPLQLIKREIEQPAKTEPLPKIKENTANKNRWVMTKDLIHLTSIDEDYLEDHDKFLEERGAFLMFHEVVYPQFRELCTLGIEVDTIVKAVLDKKISRQEGTRRIREVQDRLDYMDWIVPQRGRFIPEIATEWKCVLSFYSRVSLDRIMSRLEKGSYDEVEAILAAAEDQRDKAQAVVMSEYAKLKQKFNVP